MIPAKSILFDKLEELVDNTSEVRSEAWEMLKQTGLPGKKSESYKYTPITTALESKLDFEPIEILKPDQSHFYKTKGNHLVIINGRFSSTHSTLTEDVQISTSEITEGKHDPFSLLNTIFSPEEVTIRIEKSSSPIFIYYFNYIGFSNPRVKLSISNNQEITVTERSFNANRTFVNAYFSFHLNKNSTVHHTKIQDYSPDVFSHESLFADQVRDSKFYTNTFSFSGNTIRNNVSISLDDENCEAHMYGLYLVDKKTHIDNNTSVDHRKPNSLSNELYKGILDEKSTGVFNGRIYVRQDAQKTNAFQSNNNILLSDDATLHTKPQLEIWADDVKCSHGCTSGQLDEEAIFYLRSRGISGSDAKAMILYAFASETLQNVPLKEVKNELETMIAEKLS